MTYEVGQILFVVPKSRTAVVPIQIVEEITKKTLHGREVSYMIRFGQDPERQIDINDIDGEIFDSADKVKRTLIERSTAALNRLVNTSVEKARVWYNGAFETAEASGAEAQRRQDDDLEGTLRGPRTRDDRGRFAPREDQDQPGLDPNDDRPTTVTLEDGTVAHVRLPPELRG